MSSIWDDARETLLGGEAKVVKSMRGAWAGFKNFALRDNVLEVAVGLMIASAFTAVVSSLVADILLPPLSLLPFMGHNLEEKFVVLKRGPNAHNGYNTLTQAAADGAVTMAYGLFLTSLVRFLGIGLSLYAIAQVYSYISKDSIIKNSVRCAYCRKEVSQRAKRCPMCTSWLDGREDHPTSSVSAT